MIETLRKIGIEGIYLNIKKAIIPQETLFSLVKNRKHFLQDQEEDKGVHSDYYYSIQFWKSSHGKQRRKRNRGI